MTGPGRRARSTVKAQSGRQAPNPYAVMGVGIEFAGAIAVLSLGGWWLDGRWGTSPLFTLIGFFLGLLGGGYNLFKSLRKYQQQSTPRRDNHRPSG